MKYETDYSKIILGSIEISLSLLILFLPLELLEFLSIEIVGGPPINGKTWMEGVSALGGSLSMRLLAIIGVFIVFHTFYFIVKLKNVQMAERSITNTEIFVFFFTVALFFLINLLIGYRWWDPNGFLGMGPLFFHSILSLIILGLLPYVFKSFFKFEAESLADSTKNLKTFAFTMIFIAYGYGLVSIIWHCCSFYAPKMIFFFFVIKLIQLWAMCSFFFMYGFKLLLNKFKPWAAYLITSICFGFCYPWHTFYFALIFTFFGLLLCILVRKTDSFLPGLILLYFAYIFHAGLPWNGPIITYFIIFPISITILGLILYSSLRLKI